MRLIFLIAFLTVLSYSSTKAQTKRLYHRDNGTKKYLHTMAVDKKLLLKDRHRNRKNRIKLGATINLVLKDSVKPGLVELKLITDSGMFVTPATYQTDSFLYDTLGKKYYTVDHIIRDTIKFFKYSDIIHIDYRNNFKRKCDNALLTAVIGSELVLIPVILTPLFQGNYKNFEMLAPMYGTGIVLTAWGYYRLKRLEKLKSFSMTNWKFTIKNRFRNN